MIYGALKPRSIVCRVRLDTWVHNAMHNQDEMDRNGQKLSEITIQVSISTGACNITYTGGNVTLPTIVVNAKPTFS